jgi:hypothetical protein
VTEAMGVWRFTGRPVAVAEDKDDCMWYVHKGGLRFGPFKTNSQAWDWVREMLELAEQK